MWLRALSALAILLATTIVGAAPVQLVFDVEPVPAVRHAIDQLSKACKLQKLGVTTGQQAQPDAACNIVIGVAGASKAVDYLLGEHKLSMGEAPESLLIRTLSAKKPRTILLAGRDVRGLMYAVLEVAEAVRLAPKGTDPLAAIHDAAESPRLRLRSVSTHLFNADLDRPWYFSEDFWHGYFSMLAKDRYNTFILTFADQTNYMAPPFPWLFEMPGFPDVKVEGLSKADQAKNYQMLRRITELASEHGLDFKLSIWQQKPVLTPGQPFAPWTHNYGPTLLKNLPTGDALIDYNTRALGKVLSECSEIRGLQLRINDESGIEDNQQHEYFKALFAAIKNCGHPVALELRYKGLHKETIDQANAAGLDLTISTKFWCEHMGLPYHPTEQDKIYSPSRYGYGTLHAHPHKYRVSYQLWNQGSSKLLLWGDPNYTARFAESCAMSDGEGFEIFAPLTDKGWGNEPGQWRIFADKSLELSEWEYPRYWLYYLTFGRMGYNPQAAADVWQRELVQRFGKGAADIEAAYRAASQVLPLVTVVNQASASEWSFWPELENGGLLSAYAVIQPSDYAQFYAIRPFRGAEGWKTEGWSPDHRGFVEDAIADKLEAKRTPVQVSLHLDQLATDTLAALDRARANAADPQSAEFRGTELDLRVLAHLARYHAAKKRAATQLEFFTSSQQAGRLPLALGQAKQAAAAWEEIARLTDGTYNDNLNFGQRWQRNWKAQLEEVQAEVKKVAGLVEQHKSADQTVRKFPGEEPLQNPPRIRHEPVTQGRADGDVEIVADVESETPPRQVLLHFRTMNQTAVWKQLPMERRADGRYQAILSSHEITQQYDMLYYLEARVSGGGTLWPDWTKETPYVVISIARPVPPTEKTR